MKLAMLRSERTESLYLLTRAGLVSVADINAKFKCDWPTSLWDLITSGRLENLRKWVDAEGLPEARGLSMEFIPVDRAPFAPLYRHPSKIWGIGLNYVEHAADLSEKAPTTYPASFIKPDTTLIGHGDTIRIPLLSQKTTAEAELGVVIGRRCKHVDRKDWRAVIAGFTPVIDMTAEDILRQNPRYLTLSKSFDTFFSFGPVFLTPDEVPDVTRLKVATVINGSVHAENLVANMTFPPDGLVSFHSAVMTLNPGDIISTGTPGAVTIRDGDRVECRISGFEALSNPVVDLKTGSK